MEDKIFGMDDYFRQNVNPEDLDSARQTIFHLLFDKSGSMSSYEDVVPICIDGYKETLLKSKKEHEILVGITKFSNDVKFGGYKFVKDISNDYSAGGSTALYQAIVESAEGLINENGTGYMDIVRAKGVTPRAIFVVFSDGQDEGVAKSAAMMAEAKRQVEYLNNREIITAFVEFGARARGVAQELGFKNILTTAATESELRNIFDILSKSSVSASKNAGTIAPNEFFV